MLSWFEWWQRRREAAGRDVLLDIQLLRHPPLRAGLSSLLAMQMMVLGLFFVLPVFLQVVLGLDAFETGLRIMPLSIAMLFAALAGPRLARIWSVRRITWCGLTFMLVSCLLMYEVIDIELNSRRYFAATVLFGIGAGLLASQLGNVIMSSVDRARSSEAGGLQGTAQNLGGSLGTALIGSILVASLTSSFYVGLETNPAVPDSVQAQLVEETSSGVPIVTTEQASEALLASGMPEARAAAIVDEYEQSQLDGLRGAIFGLAMLAFVGFWLSRGLPRAVGLAAPTDAAV